jgi:DNA-binding FadR family transcriptional regulator
VAAHLSAGSRAVDESVAPLRRTIGRQVRVPKTAELVAAALRRRIVRGDLGPGDGLPSESELMEQFGVSRPTLREAFRVLESELLIEVRRGVHGGARVNAPDLEVAARYSGLILEFQNTTLGDVYQASAMIEPPCARQLASRHTADDLDRLRVALEAEKVALVDPMSLVEAQDAFHRLVVELVGNQTMSLLVGIVRSIVDKANAAHIGTDDSAAQRAQARKGHRAHAKLVELIEAGDAAAAEQLWTRHISATDDVVNSLGATTVLDILD